MPEPSIGHSELMCVDWNTFQEFDGLRCWGPAEKRTLCKQAIRRFVGHGPRTSNFKLRVRTSATARYIHAANYIYIMIEHNLLELCIVYYTFP